MQTERQSDRRVIRSRSAIRKAFLRLLSQKDAGEITVTDVAAAANVDRKTVYNAYGSTAAILDDLENELVGIVGRSVAESECMRVLRDPFGFLQAVTDAFSMHSELSEPLVERNKRSKVLEKLGAAFSERIGRFLKAEITPSKQQYASIYADFLTSGIVSVYRDWIAAGKRQPLEEVASQLRLLLTRGIAAIRNV